VARSDRVAFMPGFPLPTVKVVIDGVAFDLAVDTGAVSLVISSRIAQYLGMDLAQPLAWAQLAGVGSSGSVPMVRLGRVSLATATATNLIAYVYNLPSVLRVDGLLGLNFLSKFRVTFEFDTRTLVIRDLSRP
jgi:predicted aspartyl protease